MAQARAAETARETAWFEVFFDLVFAVAVAFWAERVSRDPAPLDYLRSLGWLLPVFWVWLGHTIYAMRFGESAARAQLVSLSHVLGVGVMSIAVLRDSGPSRLFGAGFVVARVGLLALYGIAGLRHTGARPISRHYLVGFGAGATLWALGLLLPPNPRLLVWVAGLTLDFSVPWIRRSV